MSKALNILLLLSLTTPSWCRLADDHIAYSSGDSHHCIREKCFHQPADACPKQGSKCSCRQITNCTAICCNVDDFKLAEGLGCANISVYGKIEALHIRNASFDVLNVGSELKKLRYLKYLSITDGRINSVIGEFAKYTTISCLNLSSNGIVKFENRSLVNLYNLSILDLSHNNLSDVPRFKKEGNVTLDISDNKNMSCSNLFEALKRPQLLDFSNKDNTFCLSPKTFHWFNSTEFLPLNQVIGIHALRKNCLRNCTCEPARLYLVPGQVPTFTVQVNCTGQNLTSLPTPLPPNTISLNVTNNNITSLDLFSSDITYQNIRDFYADNNQITSVLPLEGSKFLSQLDVLSLRNNKLKSIPTYVFSNIFDRNTDFFPKVANFGLNKLHCDCNTAKVLTMWLKTKLKNIRDYNEITCGNMDALVIELDPKKLCRSQQDWTDYIYYIIAVEVILLASLIAKVVYDYCIFKTSGYLPWPASKMPKLPCDWLCE